MQRHAITLQFIIAPLSFTLLALKLVPLTLPPELVQ
jgi:hypothetical protein